MKVTAFLLLFLFLALETKAQEPWEKCLDQGDFNFSADTFLKSLRASKSGCVMTFLDLSTKGTKYQVNVCDANINIGEFESRDSENVTKQFAGSTGCPAPLFGADFGVVKKGGVEFDAAKAKVMEIFQAVKKVYGPTITVKDAARLENTPNSETKIACAQLLLEEYLNNCSAFEAKKNKLAP